MPPNQSYTAPIFALEARDADEADRKKFLALRASLHESAWHVLMKLTLLRARVDAAEKIADAVELARFVRSLKQADRVSPATANNSASQPAQVSAGAFGTAPISGSAPATGTEWRSLSARESDASNRSRSNTGAHAPISAATPMRNDYVVCFAPIYVIGALSMFLRCRTHLGLCTKIEQRRKGCLRNNRQARLWCGLHQSSGLSSIL